MRGKRLLALLVAVAAAAACAAEPEPYRPLPPLALTNLTVRIGLPQPFSVLHVSDSHVTRIDSRDPAALRDFALKRSRMGRGWGDYYLDEAVALARRERMTVVHTGDLVAFCGEACLEYAGRRLRTDDILACVGNHEYWLGEGLCDVRANRAACLPRLKRAFGEDLAVRVREMNGVCFLAFDNASATVAPAVTNAFEAVVRRGKPMVVVCHVPFPTADLKAFTCDGDDVTRRFTERMRQEPLLKAILAGHVHRHHASRFSGTALELVAGALFNGEAQRIRFE